MDLRPEPILPASPSKRVALAIAEICPKAIFCTFLPTADGRKIPYNRSGRGVSDQTPKQDLYTVEQMQESTEPEGHFWGLYMHEPLFDCFESSLLTILDVDMKRTSSSTDMRITKLAKWAKDNDHLTERSHSKKGRHVIFLAKACEAAPKYKLADHQEIEVFGQPHSPKKSVMLTGDMLSQDSLSTKDVDLMALIDHLGITPEKPKQPEPAKLEITHHLKSASDYDRASTALNYISPDCDYTDWIMIGQALHTEFGDAGLTLWHGWSQGGSKYQGAKDIESHWKSFHADKGVSMGTLFHMAKQNGYTPPTPATERKTAIEDFMANVSKPVEDSQPAPVNTIDEPTKWDELDYDLAKLEPVNYMIKGFLSHSLSIFSGQPGVGKTTVLINLMLTVIGATIPDNQITTAKPRKVIIVSEDAEQVIRSLHGYAKHFNIPISLIKSRIVIIRAQRSTLPNILDLHKNIAKHTLDGVRPWLILDTANATLELENENDNSEVGAYMNGIKQTIYTQMETPITIVQHLNKQISKTDSDAMARGASAWTGDATLTAVIFMDEDGTRYMKLTKRRYEPEFDEIAFTTTTFTEPALTQDGEMQDVVLRVMVATVSSEQRRQEIANQAADQRKLDRSMSKADEACTFIQDMINRHPEGVIIRRGSHAPRTPPDHLRNCRQITWDEIHEAVPGSSRGDVKRAIGEEVFKRFAPGSSTNDWVRLGGNNVYE